LAELIIPCFSEHQAEAEGKIIGRLLAGYGELELEMCVAAVTNNNLDGAIKIFRVRGGENRITAADTLKICKKIRPNY
jgi:hypothetical protein